MSYIYMHIYIFKSVIYIYIYNMSIFRSPRFGASMPSCAQLVFNGSLSATYTSMCIHTYMNINKYMYVYIYTFTHSAAQDCEHLCLRVSATYTPYLHALLTRQRVYIHVFVGLMYLYVHLFQYRSPRLRASLPALTGVFNLIN